jgi:hypothetical protein
MENLSWSDHANFVVGKLSSAVFMVNSLRATVNDKCVKMVYYAQCLFGYAIWNYSLGMLYSSSEYRFCGEIWN